ncbi:hypothetical protein COLO4_00059 [Corchorus olitorius]|uniref:Uncharacterized protein n=1 Tax=Corchorus olitorius TaxID=93759 RepID=A0A1R3L4T0_9ROSI|nr:hypothetical protein COLO4_00059 [Corchorus olitorius]
MGPKGESGRNNKKEARKGKGEEARSVKICSLRSKGSSAARRLREGGVEDYM